jgi:hypothetical protein
MEGKEKEKEKGKGNMLRETGQGKGGEGRRGEPRKSPLN